MADVQRLELLIEEVQELIERVTVLAEEARRTERQLRDRENEIRALLQGEARAIVYGAIEEAVAKYNKRPGL